MARLLPFLLLVCSLGPASAQVPTFDDFVQTEHGNFLDNFDFWQRTQVSIQESLSALVNDSSVLLAKKKKPSMFLAAF